MEIENIIGKIKTIKQSLAKHTSQRLKNNIEIEVDEIVRALAKFRDEPLNRKNSKFVAEILVKTDINDLINFIIKASKVETTVYCEPDIYTSCLKLLNALISHSQISFDQIQKIYSSKEIVRLERFSGANLNYTFEEIMLNYLYKAAVENKISQGGLEFLQNHSKTKFYKSLEQKFGILNASNKISKNGSKSILSKLKRK